MDYKEFDNGLLLRVKKGKHLVETIIEFCDKLGIDGAVFYGIGAIEKIELGYYDAEKRSYEFKELDKFLEVTNLTGNVAKKDGQLIVHAHITLADKNLQAYGGHLKEAVVGGTIELFFTKTPGLVRQDDDETGLALLNLGAK